MSTFRLRRRELRRPVLMTVGTVLALALAGGCSATSSGPVGTGGGGGSQLTVALFQNPDSLDPAATGLVSVSQIDAAIFDTLTYKFAGDDKIYPGLATSYEISPDGTTYTLHLRTGVKFQDGTPFNAQAVKANFDHIVDPATKSKSAIGALGPYKETQVVDDSTAKVVFKEPNLAFENEMSQVTLGMSSPTALQKYGAGYGNHPVGTGPFTFESFTNGQQVRVTRNPDYAWGPDKLGSGPAKLDAITFRILSDPSAQRNALNTNEVQVAGNLTPQDVATAVGAGAKTATATSSGMPYGYLINVDKAPTNDLAVRQAIQLAVDKKSILDTLFEGQFDPASSVLTASTPGFVADGVTYDPDKAGQMLDQAGWTKGPDGMRSKGGTPLTLDLINITGFGFDDISTLLQAQLKKVGIAVTITDQGFPAVATTYNQGTQNLANWFYYDVDPFTLNTVFACNQVQSGFNWSHYCNADLDAKIIAANATVDRDQRTKAYQDIVTTLNQAAAFLPIYDTKTVLVTKGVSGIQFGPTGQPYFTSATR
ncbi:ABC-type transporter, periplasmic subunit [Pseudonocardia dioxanivorans CB1190]|uniref:ABC-type transporter, periplasmic subunit n=1 Tax=Pseudonocardia dioxanivorans (strain ATCC 55486 / DSM 44775 / JCM 13855 / CB1190) TaxID=675635 RepID=F4CK21_PSEUX|nr:ABC transporter substrate-binding protein [Pseudonocardia dioxanivorans]AEA28127.1 ABC-type transporter, periplasmic subunit [Pseudonocardia dioxanivorans CB1190]